MAIGPDDRYSWVTSYLMLGAWPQPGDLGALCAAGIGGILSVRNGAEPERRYRRRRLAFLQVPIGDFAPPTTAQLDACCGFIDAQRELGRAVLVHCALGVGRSAAVSLAYLTREGQSLGEALALLREKRPRIGPSAAQLAAVALYVQAGGSGPVSAG
jgi:protein-tyrosine phosphatase